MRVFVTGLGIVSPLALGARATMAALMEGRTAFAPLGLFDTTDQRTHLAAEVRNLAMSDVAPAATATAWSRTDAMALIAAREALAEASIDPRSSSIDLLVGGTTGGMFETEAMLAEMYGDADRRHPVATMSCHPLSATSDRLVATLGPFARARTLCSACSGGANAILLAAASIRAGKSTRVLAGGTDGLCRLTYTGFNALGAVAREPCRPFDRRRAGLILGEGAAFLVLESEASVAARGGAVLAELAGAAVGSEAHHITNPEESGRTAATLIERAIARAGLSASAIDYVNAHGTGTLLNDAMESRAIRLAFGSEVRRVAVSSSKGQIGHTLGAAGAIEAAICVLAVSRGEIPPTGGLEEPAEECDLLHVMGQGQKKEVRAALSNSFGFGGTDTVLLFSQPQSRAPYDVSRARMLRGEPSNAVERDAVERDAFERDAVHHVVQRDERERDAPPPLASSHGAVASPARSSSDAPRVVVTGGATVGPLGLLVARDSLVYLAPGPVPTGDPVSFVAQDHFDLARARRLDRPARLLTLVMQTAQREATREAPLGAELGAVAGSAYGSVDASGEFLQRMFEKGARLASPIAFPSLVPSSPVGHAAIYLGMRGPVLATHDLAISGESAVVLACQMIETGEANAIIAASMEEKSAIVERVLGPVCGGTDSWVGVRSEGASAAMFEDEKTALARGAKPLAYVASFSARRGDPADVLDEMTPPGETALVVVARRDEATLAALAKTAWRDVPIAHLAPRAGNHEALGGFAVVVGAAAIAEKRASTVLVLGIGADRAAALVLSDR